MIKLWGLLDELLTSIIKLLIDGRNQCESQFCVVLVVKRAQKKKRLDETHFFTIPIWILKVTIQTSILRIMFFSLCRAVRTTAKKKKKLQSYCDKSKKIFFITIGSNFAIWLASSFFDRNADHASRVNVWMPTLESAWNGCFDLDISWLTRNMQTNKRQGALLIACCLSWAVESNWYIDPWTKWKKN